MRFSRCENSERDEACEKQSVRGFQVSCSAARRRNSDMDVSSVLWFEVFRFQDKDDLTRTAGVCFEWWTMIMRGPYLKELERDDLDLSGTGSVYQSSVISNRHFQQIKFGVSGYF